MRRALAVVLAVVIGGAIGMDAASAQTLPPGGTFIDDDDSVHEANIEAIADADITRGCNPPEGDFFCPSDPVTRQQMAAFLVRALDLPATDEDFFTDDDGTIFESDINRLAAAGVTRGCNPPDRDRYCGTDRVTRQQMAAFLVRAYGYPASSNDRFTDDDGSIFEADIQALAAAGVTVGCNPPDNDRFCPTDRISRAQMASFIARAEGLDPIVPPPPAIPDSELVAFDLSEPVYLTAPIGDDRRFIVEKTGDVLILAADGELLAEPFLTIPDTLLTGGGERGLLSMAFHPDYPSDPRVFVYHTGPAKTTGMDNTAVIAEYTVSGDPDVVDDSSRRVVLEVDQPYSNHNGGHLLFGPDGLLYLGLGDGGSGGDPLGSGQDTGTLLGSIIRIDIDGAEPYAVPADNPYVGVDGEDEIFVFGVRNPWRLAFDGDRMYIADVGQGAREEVSVIGLDDGGANLGWNRLEGSLCYPAGSSCSSAGTVLPIVEYTHDGGSCSITGGAVYRGDDLPVLRGSYLYADLCRGFVRSFRYTADGDLELVKDLTDLVGVGGGIWSFGVDGAGEMYIISGSNGTVHQIVAG